MRDWSRANEKLIKWEAEGKRAEDVRKTIADAWDIFIADLESRNLCIGTIEKYKFLRKQLDAFSINQGLRFLDDLNLETLTQFRNGWTDGPRTRQKRLQRLRSFLRFAEKHKWIQSNPAVDLKPPKIPLSQTMPFTVDEMTRILKTCDKYAEEVPRHRRNNRLRMRAFVLLLRYSGIRIGDAACLAVDRLEGNRLFLYTAKSGTPVKVILPDAVVKAITEKPKTPKYFFWTGGSKASSAAGHWGILLSRIFTRAGIAGGHAHRFRDTFAVELLLAGIPIERVSMLLGHQSVRITEQHYAPWVHARQAQLEADLKTAWNQDVLLQTQQ